MRMHTNIAVTLRNPRLQVAMFGLAYFACARAGLAFAVEPQIIALWPASGLYLGVLLITARRRWPAFAAAAFAAGLAASLIADTGLTTSIGIGVAAACEGLLAAIVVTWVAGTPFALTRVRQSSPSRLEARSRRTPSPH